MLENLNEALDKGFYTGVLLTDLSKAFDSLSHGLLIAKFNAYGFSEDALNLINDYLTGRKQEPKLIRDLVLGAKLFMGFHREQYYDHYFLISI